MLVRHLGVRTDERGGFVCEINLLQVQQMSLQTGSGHRLGFASVAPERWHEDRAASGH